MTQTTQVLKVPISYLGEADRQEVAARTMAWASDRALDALNDVVESAGALRYLAEQVDGAPSPLLVLKAMAGAEGQVMVRLRIARAWAEVAGPYLPDAVRVALDGFPQEMA